MFYNLLVHRPTNTAFIKESSEGLSDHEFELGIRIATQINSLYVIENIARDYLTITSKEEWNEFLDNLACVDQDGLKDIRSIMRPKYDNSPCTEKYARGPYARHPFRN